jgi:hypothetical protein
MTRAPALLLLAAALTACATGRPPGAGPDASAGQAAAARIPHPDHPLARALGARAVLDHDAEVRHLHEAARGDDAAALVALRRLGQAAEVSPALARAVDAGLRDLLAAGRLTGLAAYRARAARIAALEALGEAPAALALRAENGAATAWALAGPFGALHAREWDVAFPPEAGPLPEEVPAPLGRPPHRTRALATPDGRLDLGPEPQEGDVFYLAADATLARGGRYLLTVGTTSSVKVFVDGVLLHERRAQAEHLPTLAQVPVALPAGTHRLLVKLARGTDAGRLHLALPRADGAPSDATFAAAAPGPAPAPPSPAPRVEGPPLAGPRALAAALEPVLGFALARAAAARDGVQADREGGKPLLAEALAAAPGSAAVRVALAESAAEDSTLDSAAARARAEAALRAALERDPASAEARFALASLLAQAERRDEADEVMDGLAPEASARPAALALRARLASARGLPERAEALVEQALRAGGACDALDLGVELAGGRDAVAVEEARARALAGCRAGAERLARLLRAKGDPAGALAALSPARALRPLELEGALLEAELHAAAGAPARAAAALEPLAAAWPRSARVWRRLADARALAGDAAGARAARERALAEDPGDLALRRALALSLPGAAEPLDDLAEDGPAAIRAYEASGRTGGAPVVMVLDASATEIHPGGAATERVHQVVHLLEPEGVDRFGEVSLPPGADVLVLRTRKPDGTTRAPERLGGEKGSISLAGLEPGDLVELEYLRPVRGTLPGGGFAAQPFFFRVAGTRLVRSTAVVRAPAGLGLAADARGLPAPEVVREGDRELLRATREDVPAFVPEPGAPPETEVLPFLQAGVGGGLAPFHAKLADAVLERTRPTEELRALARAVRADAAPAASPAALVRAAHARVAREILDGGGLPSGLSEDASEVVSRGRGSRLVVLKAVLDLLGVEARFALARPFSADAGPWRFPPPSLHGVALLRVRARGIGAGGPAGASARGGVAEGAAPGELWIDPGLRLAPLGALPPGVLGQEALVLGAPGEPLEVARVPAQALAPDGEEFEARVALDASGGAVIAGSLRLRGGAAGAARAWAERLGPDERRQAVEGMLQRSFRGFALGELELAGEHDPEAPLELRFSGAAPSLLRDADGGARLDGAVQPARLSARFVARAARTTPLLVAAEDRSRVTVTVVPPPGLSPRARAPVALETPFGSLARTERVVDGALVREEEVVLLRGRIAPERYGEFAAFAAAVDEAQRNGPVFEAAPQAEGAAAAKAR